MDTVYLFVRLFRNLHYLAHRLSVPVAIAASRLLRLWVRIPLNVWTFVCCECCVLLGRGLCDKLIPRPEEIYKLCCVVECDLETS